MRWFQSDVLFVPLGKLVWSGNC